MTHFTAPFIYPDHGHLIVTTSANDMGQSWRNSMDIVWTDGAGPPLPTESVVTDFIDFLKGIQRNDCHISGARLAVWAKGNLPLADQPAYWEESLSIPCASSGTGTCFGGTSTPGTTPPGEICLLIKKHVFGRAFRAGNMFIRNSLGLENFNAPTGGPPEFVSSFAASAAAAINTWCTSKLGPHTEAADLPRYCLVHAQKLSPDLFDVFESPITSPSFARVTMHDIGRG